MSGGFKQHKGQLQTVDGSATGEYVITNLFDNNADGSPQYIGEAKFGTLQNDNRWWITQYRYDGLHNLIGAYTATSQVSSGATAVTVDTTSNPGFATITLTGGDVSYISINDGLFLQTPSNSIKGTLVAQVILPNQVLVAVPATPETNTPIATFDVTFKLNSEDLKGFDKRRWDLRSLYVYA
jgi:YD repeat-containing protein